MDDIYDEIPLEDPTQTVENPYVDENGHPINDLPEMFEDDDDPRTKGIEADYD